MPHFITTWLITAVSLLMTAYVIPGFKLDSIPAAAIAAIVVGLANATIRPLLVLLTLPLTLLTLGIFYFVINALTLWLASAFSPGFHIDGFIPAFIGSVVLSVISGLLNCIFNDSD
ncbi:MAG: phage holin family protein [Thermosynechococcaceae cyanobacterium]